MVVVGSQPPVNKRARIDAVVPSVTFNEDQRALIDAIDNGDADKLSSLLARTPALINTVLQPSAWPPHQRLGTPLFYAAFKGKVAIVDLLIRSGSPVNASIDGATALKCAAIQGHTETIEILIRHGADVNFTPSGNDSRTRTALGTAVENRQLEASIYLVQLGANLEQTYIIKEARSSGEIDSSLHTPLTEAIQSGFVELIDWLLKVGRLQPETMIKAVNISAFHLALKSGPLPVVQAFIEHGAKLDATLRLPGGTHLPRGIHIHGVWRIADFFKRFDVVELLLRRGLQPIEVNEGNYGGFAMHSSEMIAHRPQLIGLPQAPADGLTDPECRDKPASMIYAFVMHTPVVKKKSGRSQPRQLTATGLSKFLAFKLSAWTDLRGCHVLLGRDPWNRAKKPDAIQLTTNQGMNAFSEVIATVCRDLGLVRPFSGCDLTPEGEAAMNYMIELQRGLLLNGASTVRTRFAQWAARLPNVCVGRYISLNGKVNERDLYRFLTKELGLYDPLARAAIRLAKVSFAELNSLSEIPMTSEARRLPEFWALPTAGRLKVVMAETLEEWDKIDEMVAVFHQADKSLEQLDLVTNLLFEQWRQFCAAFGVQKPVWVPPEQRALSDTTSTSSSTSSTTSSATSSATSSDSASSKTT